MEGQHVAGQVRDRSGAPLLGARVIIGYGLTRTQVETRPELWAHYETTTDDAGAFAFDGVVPDPLCVYPLLIWACHGATASVRRELPDGAANIELVVLDTGGIAGLVHGLGGDATAVARRLDEPLFARVEIVDKRGEFQFDDVPFGDYVVSLNVPPAERLALASADLIAQAKQDVVASSCAVAVSLPCTEQVSCAHVSVVANQTAQLTLGMVRPSVRLHVRVTGTTSAEWPVLVAEDDPSRPVPGLGMSQWDDVATYQFDYVLPGAYRVSIGGKTRKPIVVTSSPAEQTIELRDPKKIDLN